MENKPEKLIRRVILADKSISKVPIEDAESAEVYSNSYTLPKSYDENDGTLFITKDAKTGWAKYRIKKTSSIRLVRLQNRPDCCGKSSKR